MKLLLKMCLSFLLLFCVGCSTPSTQNNDATTDNTVVNEPNEQMGAFASTSVGNQISSPAFDEDLSSANKENFEKTNVIDFSVGAKTDRGQFGTEIEFIAKNNGSDTIKNLKVFFSVLDSSGTERAATFSESFYGAFSGKSIAFSPQPNVSFNDFSELVFSGYRYSVSNKMYFVDLVAKETVSIPYETNTKLFEEKNILSFSFEPIGAKNGDYWFDATVTNNTSDKLAASFFYTVFLDDSGNVIYIGSGSVTPLPNSSKTENEFTSIDNNVSQKIATIGVTRYTYSLEEPDEYGNVTYLIDLVNMDAIGSNN